MARLLCFDIKNFEPLLREKPFAIEEIEEALAAFGAVPVRVDLPTRRLCVSLERGEIAAESVLALLIAKGFEAEIAR